MNVVISFLDESKTVFQISVSVAVDQLWNAKLCLQQKSLGKHLFYQVCESLNLIEYDYFGLEYVDSNQTQVIIKLLTHAN